MLIHNQHQDNFFWFIGTPTDTEKEVLEGTPTDTEKEVLEGASISDFDMAFAFIGTGVIMGWVCLSANSRTSGFSASDSVLLLVIGALLTLALILLQRLEDIWKNSVIARLYSSEQQRVIALTAELDSKDQSSPQGLIWHVYREVGCTSQLIHHKSSVDDFLSDIDNLESAKILLEAGKTIDLAEWPIGLELLDALRSHASAFSDSLARYDEYERQAELEVSESMARTFIGALESKIY